MDDKSDDVEMPEPQKIGGRGADGRRQDGSRQGGEADPLARETSHRQRRRRVERIRVTMANPSAFAVVHPTFDTRSPP